VGGDGLPFNSGQQIQTFPGPKLEYCENVISRNIIGIAHKNMNMKYGIRKAPKNNN
jgi:hypothetical protein